MTYCNATIYSLSLLIIMGCASPPKNKMYPVLELVKPKEAVKERESHPAYDKLEALLLSLGYEPVGMQFETEGGLELLTEVFSNPIAQRRKIKLVYTGIQMQYDKVGQSLTVGGLTNVKSILTYIQRNVPVEPNPISLPPRPYYVPSVTASPTPTPTASPTPTPTLTPSVVPTPSVSPSPRSEETGERNVTPPGETPRPAPDLIEEENDTLY